MTQLNYDFDIDLATAHSRLSKKWKNRKWRWSELVARCRETTRTGESAAEYQRMTREEQSNVKDVGGFVGGYLSGGTRKTASVLWRSMATLDIDYGTPDVWDDFTLLFPFAAMLYSTHKHTPDQPRYRLVIPFSRPVKPGEYEPVCRKLAEAVGIDLFDITTYQLARLFYWPSTSRDGEYVFHVQDGPACNPDELLKSYADYRDVSAWPLSSREGDIISHEMRKAGDPLEKTGLIGAFCRTYTIEDAIARFLPDVYEPTATEGRYTYKKGSVAGGLVCYEGKFAYSHHETDPASRQLCNAFDLCRIHLFGVFDEGSRTDDITRRPSYLKMQDFAAAQPEVRVLLTRERRKGAEEDFEGLDTVGVEATDTDWMSALEYDRKGAIKPTTLNAICVLDNDPALKGHLLFDEFRQTVILRGGLPWNKEATRWTDADNAQLRAYMEREYGITGKDKIRDAFTVCTSNHAFHPVRDYLDSLRWDGVRRMERAVIDYVGAEDTDTNRKATAIWMTGAVARIYRPGIKFDHCLILQGEQGVGKSTFFEVLAGEWYNGNLSLMNNDRGSLEQLRGSWIIELQELDSMKRSEASAIKSFITNPVDRYRAAYKETTEDFPRQCVFGGTTNDSVFLKDSTGERRFWVTPVDPAKRTENNPREALLRDRDQLWAEAVHAYKTGGLPVPDRDFTQAMRRQTQGFSITGEDPLPDMVATFLDIRLPPDWSMYTLDQRRRYYKDGEDMQMKGTQPREAASVTEFVCEYLCIDRAAKDYLYKSAEVKNIMDNEDGWEYAGRQRYRYGSLYQKLRTYIRKEDGNEEDDI